VAGQGLASTIVTSPEEQTAPVQVAAAWLRAQWRLLIGLALSALCLYLAFRKISWTGLRDALVVADWGWVVLASVVVVVSTFLKAVRWKTLFLPRRITLRRAWSVYMIGQMLNAVLPARAGDASRIYLIGGEGGASRAAAFSTLVVEKVVDLLMLALAYMVVAVWLSRTSVGLPDWLREAGAVLVPVAALGLMGLLLIAQFGQPVWHLLRKALGPLPERWRERADSAAGQAIGAMQAFPHGQTRGQVWGLSLVIWVLMIVPNLLVLEAFGLRLGPWVALLLLVVLMSGVAAPRLPGNIGVYAYLCQLVLQLFGVDRETGLALGITLQMVVYLPQILVGSFCMLRKDAAPMGTSPGTGTPC
jgi:glycosyltransferase 2 family protein